MCSVHKEKSLMGKIQKKHMKIKHLIKNCEEYSKMPPTKSANQEHTKFRHPVNCNVGNKRFHLETIVRGYKNINQKEIYSLISLAHNIET